MHLRDVYTGAYPLNVSYSPIYNVLFRDMEHVCVHVITNDIIPPKKGRIFLHFFLKNERTGKVGRGSSGSVFEFHIGNNLTELCSKCILRIITLK